ncbi:iron-regulated protein A [Vibrio sp. AK197]
MSRLKFTVSLLVMGVLGCQSSPQQSPFEMQTTSHLSQAVYEVEFEFARSLYQQAEQLNQQFGLYCQSPSEQGSQHLKTQWQMTMASWMALQGQERGPLNALEQSWNIQFWPDKKNTTGLKMSALLKQSTVPTVNQLATQSVTVQGLGALEWLLYEPQVQLHSDPQACQLGEAVAQNLLNKAQIIASAWQKNPWITLDKASWYAEYIALLSNQLEFSMSKLTRPLGNIGHPRPYFAESWRSKNSMLNLKANLQAIEQLYLTQRGGLDNLLRERGRSDLADRVKNQLRATIETWSTQESLFDLLATKQGYQQVLAQYNKLEQLKYLIHQEVAVELEVVIGFNATDGD